MRALALTLLIASLLAAGSMQHPPVVAQDAAPEPAPANVSEETWNTFLGLLRADSTWKALGRFKKADIEPALPEWSRQLGRPLEVRESDYLYVDWGVHGPDGEWYRLVYDWHGEPAEKVYMLHVKSKESDQRWVVPEERASTTEFRYVRGIRAGDPFNWTVENINLNSVSATDMLADLCNRIGCSCVLTQEDTKVRVHVKSAKIGELMREIGETANLKVAPTQLHADSVDTAQLFNEFTSAEIQAAEPVEMLRRLVLADVKSTGSVIVTARKAQDTTER